MELTPSKTEPELQRRFLYPHSADKLGALGNHITNHTSSRLATHTPDGIGVVAGFFEDATIVAIE